MPLGRSIRTVGNYCKRSNPKLLAPWSCSRPLGTRGDARKGPPPPRNHVEQIVSLAPSLASLSPDAARQVMIDVKYSGYVERQEQAVARSQRLSEKRIPSSFDYARIQHLRAEAREKLTRVRPLSLAQASRISGITPADLALVMAWLGK